MGIHKTASDNLIEVPNNVSIAAYNIKAYFLLPGQVQVINIVHRHINWSTRFYYKSTLFLYLTMYFIHP